MQPIISNSFELNTMKPRSVPTGKGWGGFDRRGTVSQPSYLFNCQAQPQLANKTAGNSQT